MGIGARRHSHGPAQLLPDVAARCRDRLAQRMLREEPAERESDHRDDGRNKEYRPRSVGERQRVDRALGRGELRNDV